MADSRALRAELDEVEADLAELRHSASELRLQVGEQGFGPGDASDRAVLITAAEEQEAFAERLEVRRDELRRRLDAYERTGGEESGEGYGRDPGTGDRP
jgi:multidrug resistance efflux pump